MAEAVADGFSNPGIEDAVAGLGEGRHIDTRNVTPDSVKAGLAFGDGEEVFTGGENRDWRGRKRSGESVAEEAQGEEKGEIQKG